MHLSPLVSSAAVRSKAVVMLLLLTFCLLLLPLWESVIVLCFVVRYFMSILVLQSSWWGRESWLFCLVCLPGVLWLLCGSSSRCHGFVFSLWLWYILIILTYFFFISISAFCPQDSLWDYDTYHLTPSQSTRSTRSSYNSQYCRPQAYSVALKYSFFPSTIPDWNSGYWSTRT